MEKVLRTERGWGGHFICADRCAFRRNTLLEHGEVRVVVSTLGAFRPWFDGDIETIGFNRYYETMVFHAKYEKPYWDADVSRQIYDLDSCWSMGAIKRNSSKEANDMHEQMVAEVSEKMALGLIT